MSALLFDASHPEVQAFAQARGWIAPGRKITVFDAELRFTLDGWRTTRVAPLVWLPSGKQGFNLRDVPKGTALEYAVHAQVGVTRDNFYSFEDRGDFWANGGGQNHRGVTLST